jgi:hypothetical protein
MPLVAILLTLAALLPFVACGLAAAGGHAEPADRMLAVLIAYAAVMLSFTGGVSWALALRSGGTPATGWRPWLLAGGMPVLLAWAALVTEHELPGWTALPILIAGHAMAVLAEHHAGWLGEMPAPYAMLRWVFAGVAVAMLTTVLILRITGSTIVF